MGTEANPGGSLPPTSAELKAEIETLRAKLGGTVSKEEAAELRGEIKLLRAELEALKKMDKEEEADAPPAPPERSEGWGRHFIT